MRVHDVATEKEFLAKAKALGATLRVLRTTSIVPTRAGGGVVLMRPAISIQYSFDHRSESSDERWVYRERWVADERNEIDTSEALLTQIMDAHEPPVIFAQRSGSI